MWVRGGVELADGAFEKGWYDDCDPYDLLVHTLAGENPAEARRIDDTSLFEEIARAFLFRAASLEGVGRRVVSTETS